MTNDTRAAFEAHMLSLNVCTRLHRQSEAVGGAYRTITVQRAWEQWQASRRLALGNALRECEEIADHWDAMHNTQASMAADQCATAIRALADEGMKD